MSTENLSPSAESDLQFGLAVRARRAQLAITLDQLAQASGVTSGRCRGWNGACSA